MIEGVRRWKYTVQDRDRHGNVRVYFRFPGQPKRRMQEVPGTDAFEGEYRRMVREARKPRRAPKPADKPKIGTVLPGSLQAACASYYGCAEFKRMDKRSQRVRRLILGHLCGTHGHKPLARMEVKHIVRIRDEKAETPEAANGMLKALRAVFKHAVPNGLAPGNVAALVPYLPPNNPDGFRTWGTREIAAYRTRWPVGTVPRLALELLLGLAVRRSDLVRLGPNDVHHGMHGAALHFRQDKGRAKNPVDQVLPLRPELAAIIAATPTGKDTFLIGGHGARYTADGFGNAFRDWCRAAGLDGYSAHGLRKARAALIADAGGSEYQVMAVLGHASPKTAAIYTRKANRMRLAREAFDRAAAVPADGKVSHPGVPAPEWDENNPQVVEKKGEPRWMVPRGGLGVRGWRALISLSFSAAFGTVV